MENTTFCVRAFNRLLTKWTSELEKPAQNHFFSFLSTVFVLVRCILDVDLQFAPRNFEPTFRSLLGGEREKTNRFRTINWHETNSRVEGTVLS